MKVIIVHGDHIEESYERITKFINVAKNRGWKIERLSGKDTQNLPEVLSATTLFNDERLFIIEDPAKTPKNQLHWIKEKVKNLPGNLVIFSESEIGKRMLDMLPKADKTEVFKFPKLIYKFLESFYPGNAEACLRILYALKDRHAQEYILAILGNHLRDVYLAKIAPDSLNYPSWRIGKLKRQADKFSEVKLNQVISYLAEADFLSKTSSHSIFDSLDLIIATQLE